MPCPCDLRGIGIADISGIIMAEGEIDNLTMKQYLALTRENQQVLDIISLFNIPGVSHDAVMLHVFPITLTGAAKRWMDKLSPGTVDYWDLLKKSFIQRYCPPCKTVKQLKEICNFKQEGDETLYQAWERYNDLLYKCPTYDINSHQKVNIIYNGLGTMNRQLLDSQGPIPGMTYAQALTSIN
ncbi:hypothetical protein Tco_1129239 [Tanacetum coccineum]